MRPSSSRQGKPSSEVGFSIMCTALSDIFYAKRISFVAVREFPRVTNFCTIQSLAERGVVRNMVLVPCEPAAESDGLSCCGLRIPHDERISDTRHLRIRRGCHNRRFPRDIKEFAQPAGDDHILPLAFLVAVVVVPRLRTLGYGKAHFLAHIFGALLQIGYLLEQPVVVGFEK